MPRNVPPWLVLVVAPWSVPTIAHATGPLAEEAATVERAAELAPEPEPAELAPEPEPSEPEDAELDELDDDQLEPPSTSSPTHEPVPGLPAPGREAAFRRGRGLLALGGVLLGLGAVGRLALEGFWAGPARLQPSEPFGRWSIPTIVVATSFPNVLMIPGLVATGLGARRHGAWRVASGARPIDPLRTRRNRRLGWGLLGGGLAGWVLTRAIAGPVLERCETNGCAYGYLESTYWISLGAVVPGVVLVGLAAGERRVDRRLTATPLLGPHARGLALGGRF
ncbi:MAG: hypothetical protein H6712_22025 [Myxococcales bacterium]|nr:hypothetical protein [Myxococcales bacterium]MCB9716553.1 hypothetical protein [Myxococcales bacterium]